MEKLIQRNNLNHTANRWSLSLIEMDTLGLNQNSTPLNLRTHLKRARQRFAVQLTKGICEYVADTWDNSICKSKPKHQLQKSLLWQESILFMITGEAPKTNITMLLSVST